MKQGQGSVETLKYLCRTRCHTKEISQELKKEDLKDLLNNLDNNKPDTEVFVVRKLYHNIDDSNSIM